MQSRPTLLLPSTSRVSHSNGRARPILEVEISLPPPLTLQLANQHAPMPNVDSQPSDTILQHITGTMSRLENRLLTLEKQSSMPADHSSDEIAIEEQPTSQVPTSSTDGMNPNWMAPFQHVQQPPVTHAVEHTPAAWMSQIQNPPCRHPLPQLHGDISKFKPDVTFNRFGPLESFLFTLRQSIAAYNLQTEPQKLLALGRSLRGEALDWWAHNTSLFSNLNEAIDDMFHQYKDLTKAGDYLCKLNRLTQTGSTRSFFRRAEKLNLHAKLPEEALWKTLKEGLNVSLRTSLATVCPVPTTYVQWKQMALELGAELDTINIIELAYRQRPLHDTERDNLKNRIVKGNHKERFTHGCFGCGSVGHNISNCPNKHNIEQAQPPTTDRKRRRQGDPYYLLQKKHDTGTVRLTELTAEPGATTNDAHDDSTASNPHDDHTLRDTDLDSSDSDVNSFDDLEKD